ncbi:MAG: hypothetical protein ACREMZ_13565 [Gemmatimonadales bacterium]
MVERLEPGGGEGVSEDPRCQLAGLPSRPHGNPVDQFPDVDQHGSLPTLDRLVNTDLQRAIGPPGKPGDPDAILDVAWNIGLQAAYGRAWSMAVWTTAVPQECISVREELARTLDQPLREVAGFGPQLLAAIDEALKAPRGGAARALKMTLTLELHNEALRRAIEAAFR